MEAAQIIKTHDSNRTDPEQIESTKRAEVSSKDRQSLAEAHKRIRLEK